MKAVQFVFLLAALTGPAKCLFNRKHIFVKEDLNWTEAQAYCRKNYVDLSTIDSAEELNKFEADIENAVYEKAWVGLSKKITDHDFTQWSDGSLLGDVVWNKEQPDYPDTEHCVTTRSAMLSDNYCNDTHRFICYTWEPQLIVVKEMKTWDEAIEHCRTFYTDLISVTTKTDQFVANNRSLDIKTPNVWTALRFQDGSWFCVNNQTTANITSLAVCPIRPFLCGARKAGAEVWKNRDCEERMNFMCYYNSTESKKVCLSQDLVKMKKRLVMNGNLSKLI